MKRHESHGGPVKFDVRTVKGYDGHLYRLIDVSTKFGHHLRTRSERVK